AAEPEAAAAEEAGAASSRSDWSALWTTCSLRSALDGRFLARPVKLGPSGGISPEREHLADAGMRPLDRFCPLGIRRDRLSDAKEKVVDRKIPDVLKALADVGAQRVILGKRTQIVDEAAELALERKHRLRVRDRPLDFLTAANDRRLLGEPVDVRLRERRDADRIEIMKSCTKVIPLRLDQRPRKAGLKDRFGQDGKVVR